MSEDWTEERVWDLITLFFAAKRSFVSQYHEYESTVLGLARDAGVDRSQLMLPAAEVSDLLDFTRLDELHQNHLVPLREVSHRLFRDRDSTDLFDRYVSNIFHEISILKEEHFEVKEHGTGFEAHEEGEEVSAILDEVHEYFPKRIHRVYKLFAKAELRLEKLLPGFGQNKVFVRSLYLMGEACLEGAYDGSLEAFYRHAYQGGIVEGYLEAARSFCDSGFTQLATEALRKANQQLEAGQVRDGQRDGVAAQVMAIEQQIARVGA